MISQKDNTGVAVFGALAGRSGAVTFKPSVLEESMSPELPKTYAGEATFSVNDAGKSGEAMFGGRLRRDLAIDFEHIQTAMSVVRGQTSMEELRGVGWTDDRLAEVCSLLDLPPYPHPAQTMLWQLPVQDSLKLAVK